MTPKTIRGKLLLAYLSLVIVFVGAGMLIFLQMSALRQSSTNFFNHYSDAEDLIISTRFLVGEVSNKVLTPTRSLDPETYIVQAGKQIDEISHRIRQSILDDEYKDQIIKSLARYDEAIVPVLRLYRSPVERMEAADAIAEQCLNQAETIDNVAIVNAVAGIVDAYTDALLTNDPGEKERFESLVRVVENNPSYSAIPSFPDFKKAALTVFSVNESYVRSIERFRETATSVARELALVDKKFHSDFLLPTQDQLIGYVERSGWVILFALLFTLVMATLISLLMRKFIWRPLMDMGGMVARLSGGDLNHRLRIKGDDEVSMIGQRLNRFADQLKNTLEQLDRQMEEMTKVDADLRKSEEYSRTLSREYQVVLDGISEALMVYDRSGSVIWSNKKASEDIYAEIDQKVSSEDYEMFSPKSHAIGQEQVEVCFSTGEKVEELVSIDDGKNFRVKAFPLLDEEGEVSRVLKVVNDVSEQLRLKEEADRANRLASLGELSAGVAHEINNPNSLVIVNSPIIRDVFEDIMPILEENYTQNGDFKLGGLSYTRLKYDIPLMLKEMHEGGMRIQRIVDDLKNFVRKDEVTQMEKVDLNIAVETSLRMVRNLISKSTNNFSSELYVGLPLIKANILHLEQVAVNLLQNACLSLPDRSRGLTVRTCISENSEDVLLIVSDEGIGIKPGDIKRVTDPFFTTRRKEGGTGLGLSVSSRLVRDCGGQMSFDSKPGEGTTVTVRFPIAK